MAVSGPETSLQTTLQSGWKKVNCGRLFCANDCAYEFFHEIECVVRLRLPQHLKSHHSCKDGLIEAIISSDNIQFLWSMLSADMDGDAIAWHEVLQCSYSCNVNIYLPDAPELRYCVLRLGPSQCWMELWHTSIAIQMEACLHACTCCCMYITCFYIWISPEPEVGLRHFSTQKEFRTLQLCLYHTKSSVLPNLR